MTEEITLEAREEKKKAILTSLATEFSDDIEFLLKVNRLTFGLTKGQK